ncbi:hypothetical protein GDO81_019065 [Engystomops pustulosus]|uniref:Uncharacterized protein n=1 Tax=Engystomops pustulosus TaxID=76066 RepID=A0AAV6ZA13_ENGPU|nr:hypothetical protein GDO81_019065 [Engystomops pustulosus]
MKFKKIFFPIIPPTGKSIYDREMFPYYGEGMTGLKCRIRDIFSLQRLLQTGGGILRAVFEEQPGTGGGFRGDLVYLTDTLETSCL